MSQQMADGVAKRVITVHDSASGVTTRIVLDDPRAIPATAIGKACVDPNTKVPLRVYDPGT